MVDERVMSYIQTSLSRGTSIEEIKKELINAGWQQELVNEAINQTSTPTASPAQKQQPQSEEKRLVSKKIIYGAIALFLLLGISIALFALTNQ